MAVTSAWDHLRTIGTAILRVRREIAEIESGKANVDNSLLRNAPHSHRLLLQGEWTRPYTREQACFPLRNLRDDKYWPPVGRIDTVTGDRHLVCGCPTVRDEPRRDT